MDYIGFRKLRAGRIHLFCPDCRRRYSNAGRQPHDPPAAVVAHVKCPDCGRGDKCETVAYLDASGRWLEPDWGQGL